MSEQALAPAQTGTPTPERPALLKSTLDGFTAKYSGGANSPNLPVGNWEFVLNAEGTDIEIETLTAKDANGNDRIGTNGKPVEYDVAYVLPKGQPDGQKRRVYTSAFTAPTAKAILFKDGVLKSGALFGVFSSGEGAGRITTVSANAEAVAKGIAAANQAYSDARKKREEAAAANG